VTNALLMVDLSSNNGPADLKAHYKAGYRTLALKATEGTTYTWADNGAMADRWHKLGGNVVHYHFARPAGRSGIAAVTQARYFLAAIRDHWKTGDRIALDAEVTGIDAAFVTAFIDTCNTHPDWPGLVYSYASFLDTAKIQPSHGWGLWLADYSSKTPPAPVKGWKRLDIWQFTRTAIGVPGMSSAVDQSHLYPAPVPAVKATRLARPTRAALWLAARNLRGRNVPVAAADQPALTSAAEQIHRVQGLK
jgi:GH25 family lysozyme M1 (1,4-beta-N-acetylmuramidase)